MFVSNGILTCLSPAALRYWLSISCQVIEEGSGFNIIPAIKRSRSIFEDFYGCVFFRPGSNFQDERSSFKYP
jgi:hypothetical protein